MRDATDRLEFVPPSEPGQIRSLGLALLAHACLLAALTWSVRWKTETVTTVTAQAELWSALPQQAAPKLVELPPDPPVVIAAPKPKPLPAVQPVVQPKPIAVPPPKPVKAPVAAPLLPVQPKVDIALEQEKQRLKKEQEKAKEREKEKAREREKEAERQREKEKAREKAKEQEKQRLDKLKQEKIKQDKLQLEKDRLKEKQQQEQREQARQAAADEKKKLAQQEAKRKEALQAQQQEAQRIEAQRQANLKRMAGLANASGGPTATGTALQTSGPSSSYAGRIRARIKPNIVFSDDIAGNPVAEVEVRTSPDGTIVSRKLTKSSGVKSWDEAVLRAIDKTEVLPRDVDGRVISPLTISFKPKD